MKTPASTLVSLVLGSLILICFALEPQARADCEQGCLPAQNTVLGDDALVNRTGGTSNTAIGFNALFSNTDGFYNTAVGAFALSRNTTGDQNTAIGLDALSKNITGNYNTATGLDALSENTTGNYNTATGHAALLRNTTGTQNTAFGRTALNANKSGDSNTAVGFSALYRNKTGSRNIALGLGAGFYVSGNDNIVIGNNGVVDDEGTIRIGKTGTQTNAYIAGVSGATIPTGVAVIVDADGHLGTTTSSGRFKEAIKPMDKASESILALKPVTFRYKPKLDPKGVPQFGLVAEDVAKVDPTLVARDDDGNPYTVRYDAVNAMLLNEFLKEHNRAEAQAKKVEAQESRIEQLESQLRQMAARLDAKGL